MLRETVRLLSPCRDCHIVLEMQLEACLTVDKEERVLIF